MKSDIIYKLEIEFSPGDYDLIISHLFDAEITEFEEGRTVDDPVSGLTLKDEDSLITLYRESMDEVDAIVGLVEDILGERFVAKISSCKNDFQDRWKEFANPIEISERIIIKPSWINEPVAARDIIIELDPGYAFGSGSHDTTILCAKAIESCCVGGNMPGSLLDVGCGSGILSIIGAKLGISSVTGIDIDPGAVAAARENAVKNNVSNITFSETLLSELDGRSDIVVANILSSTLMELMSDLKRLTRKGGLLVLSGILSEESDELVSKIELPLKSFQKSGEWCCLQYRVETVR
jgi:ribosomal protein L11 methyltransferase